MLLEISPLRAAQYEVWSLAKSAMIAIEIVKTKENDDGCDNEEVPSWDYAHDGNGEEVPKERMMATEN